MKIKHLFFLLIPMMLLASCVTSGSAPDPEFMVHEPSGMMIPLKSGSWRWSKTQKFSEDGTDTGWHYKPEGGDGGLVTLYVYPAEPDMTAELWQEHYDLCLRAMTGRFRDFELVEEEIAYPEGMTLVRYQANGSEFYTLLWLVYDSGWYIKYRITVDSEAWPVLEKEVSAMIRETVRPTIAR